MAENKIKYGISSVYYSVITENGNTITYGTPVALPGAVSLSISPKGDESNFYADNYAYYKQFANQGYEGDLEIALITEDFREDVLNEIKDSKGVFIEKANATIQSFALGFEVQGDQKAQRFWFYNCTCSRPNVEAETKSEAIDPKTEQLSLIVSPRADGKVGAKSSSTTDSATYSGWFSAVVEETAASGD